MDMDYHHQEDSDFDEAFKNLLRPIEMISKFNQGEQRGHADLVKVILSLNTK